MWLLVVDSFQIICITVSPISVYFDNKNKSNNNDVKKEKRQQ
jgi:hypothetical protein